MKHPRRHTPQPASAPELPPIIIKQLGSLWVLNHFMKRLRIAEIIDGLCPTAPQVELTHGQVIAAMVANRLTSPQPLVHVHRWAQEWAVPEVFGITAGLLNDDRLGRALDAIFPYIDDLKGFIAWSALMPSAWRRRSSTGTSPASRSLGPTTRTRARQARR